MIIEREVQELLRSIPGITMEDDPYFPYYANQDLVPPPTSVASTSTNPRSQGAHFSMPNRGTAPPEDISEEEEDPDELPFPEEEPNQEDQAIEEGVNDEMEPQVYDDNYLSPNEEEDDAWLLPVNEPTNWAAEQQWALMHPEPIGSIPPPQPPPESDSEEDTNSDVDNNLNASREPPVYAVDTYVFVEIAPLYPCPWKRKAQPYYLGPTRVLVSRQPDYYKVVVPPGFAEHYSDTFLYPYVSNRRPKDTGRIISNQVDLTNSREYVEAPIHIRYEDDLENSEEEPRWIVFWECYGVVEQIEEPESLLRRHYPSMFQD